MNPALWGSLCALSLGTADFLARFSSRAIGHTSALLGMLLVGSALLSLYVWVSGPELVWTASHLWLIALNGAATTAMTLLLYLGLARGPVSIVAPIVASHPALVVLLAVSLGARPSTVQWAAMVVTMAGVVVIARSAGNFADEKEYSRQDLKQTILIALASSVCYAVLVSAGQAAVPVYGELQTLWLGRLISLATLLLIALVTAERPSLPLSWWPFLGAQGVLDAGGYLFLFAGSHGEGAEIAAVTASTFGVVTTLLARVVLRENIRVVQWLGIALVFVGVAVLSGAPAPLEASAENASEAAAAQRQ